MDPTFARRCREGIAVSLYDFQQELRDDYYLVVSILDKTDDISWLGVSRSGSHGILKVNVPEPCLSEHSFEVNRFICKCLPSDAGWNGLRIVEERTSLIQSLISSKSSQLEFTRRAVWDRRQSYANVRFVRGPKVTIESSHVYDTSVCWEPESALRFQCEQWGWLVSVVNTTQSRDKFFFFSNGLNQNEFVLPRFLLSPGNSYKIAVCPLAPAELENDAGITDGLWLSQYSVVYHRAVLTNMDLNELFEKSIAYSDPTSLVRCAFLYRNKSHQYFENIDRFNYGIMETYLKDDSGDPASAINGHLPGLFFMATPASDGLPPKVSQFGPRRFEIPAEVLLEKFSCCYFCDFYCMQGNTHYVTLVMTEPGSAADEFCHGHNLPMLDMELSNPFLFKDLNDGLFYVNNTKRLKVELFFTDSINIYNLIRHFGGRLSTVGTVARGSSTPGGIRKNQDCDICNLPWPPP